MKYRVRADGYEIHISFDNGRVNIEGDLYDTSKIAPVDYFSYKILSGKKYDKVHIYFYANANNWGLTIPHLIAEIYPDDYFIRRNYRYLTEIIVEEE